LVLNTIVAGCKKRTAVCQWAAEALVEEQE
jgi:hypothetical protein